MVACTRIHSAPAGPVFFNNVGGRLVVTTQCPDDPVYPSVNAPTSSRQVISPAEVNDVDSVAAAPTHTTCNCDDCYFADYGFDDEELDAPTFPTEASTTSDDDVDSFDGDDRDSVSVASSGSYYCGCDQCYYDKLAEEEEHRTSSDASHFDEEPYPELASDLGSDDEEQASRSGSTSDECTTPPRAFSPHPTTQMPLAGRKRTNEEIRAYLGNLFMVLAEQLDLTIPEELQERFQTEV